jgi:hypothetical protein
MIEESDFDEIAREDPRSVATLAANAINDLEIALFKATPEEAVFLTNAIGELERLSSQAK